MNIKEAFESAAGIQTAIGAAIGAALPHWWSTHTDLFPSLSASPETGRIMLTVSAVPHYLRWYDPWREERPRAEIAAEIGEILRTAMAEFGTPSKIRYDRRMHPKVHATAQFDGFGGWVIVDRFFRSHGKGFPGYEDNHYIGRPQVQSIAPGEFPRMRRVERRTIWARNTAPQRVPDHELPLVEYVGAILPENGSLWIDCPEVLRLDEYYSTTARRWWTDSERYASYVAALESARPPQSLAL